MAKSTGLNVSVRRTADGVSLGGIQVPKDAQMYSHLVSLADARRPATLGRDDEIRALITYGTEQQIAQILKPVGGAVGFALANAVPRKPGKRAMGRLASALEKHGLSEVLDVVRGDSMVPVWFAQWIGQEGQNMPEDRNPKLPYGPRLAGVGWSLATLFWLAGNEGQKRGSLFDLSGTSMPQAVETGDQLDRMMELAGIGSRKIRADARRCQIAAMAVESALAGKNPRSRSLAVAKSLVKAAIDVLDAFGMPSKRKFPWVTLKDIHAHWAGVLTNPIQGSDMDRMAASQLDLVKMRIHPWFSMSPLVAWDPRISSIKTAAISPDQMSSHYAGMPASWEYLDSGRVKIRRFPGESFSVRDCRPATDLLMQVLDGAASQSVPLGSLVVLSPAARAANPGMDEVGVLASFGSKYMPPRVEDGNNIAIQLPRPSARTVAAYWRTMKTPMPHNALLMSFFGSVLDGMQMIIDEREIGGVAFEPDPISKAYDIIRSRNG